MAYWRNQTTKYIPRPIPPTPPYVPPTPPTPPTPEQGSEPDIPRPTLTTNSNITLYHCYDDNKVVDKTYTDGITFSGAFINDTDVLNPIVELESNISLIGYNYAYIDTTNRFYFVKVVLLPTNRFRIVMNVDYLTSHAQGIKQCKGIVSRCEDERYVNTDLVDGSVVNQEGVAIKLDVFDNGFLDIPIEILVVAGGGYS